LLSPFASICSLPIRTIQSASNKYPTHLVRIAVSRASCSRGRGSRESKGEGGRRRKGGTAHWRRQQRWPPPLRRHRGLRASCRRRRSLRRGSSSYMSGHGRRYHRGVRHCGEKERRRRTLKRKKTKRVLSTTEGKKEEKVCGGGELIGPRIGRKEDTVRKTPQRRRRRARKKPTIPSLFPHPATLQAPATGRRRRRPASRQAPSHPEPTPPESSSPCSPASARPKRSARQTPRAWPAS